MRKLGKQPARYDSRDLVWEDLRPKGVKLPSFPKPHGGYGGDFASSPTGWRGLGNMPCDDGSIVQAQFPAAFDGAGDCFPAGQCHSVMEACRNGGAPIPDFTSLNVLRDNYTPITVLENNGQGYDPVSGANDVGTDPRTGLSYHQKTGMVDAAGHAHKIGPYYSVEINLDTMWDVLWLSQCLGLGLVFTDAAMHQFEKGQTWTYVPGAAQDGGHWVIVVGHPDDSIWSGVTWERRQHMTGTYIDRQADEVWAWIDLERFNAVTGKDAESWDAADVEKYLALEAQQVVEQTGSGSVPSQTPITSLWTTAVPGPEVEPAVVATEPAQQAGPPVTPAPGEGQGVLPPQEAPSTLPVVPLESFTQGRGVQTNTIEGQRQTRVESEPDPDKYRQERMAPPEQGWAPTGMPAGPFPGV